MKSKEIQKRAGVTRIQIVRWTELGIIIPLEDHRGRGKQREYSTQNLAEAIICKTLNQAHVETRTMKTALDYLRARKIIRLKDEKERYSFWEFMKFNPDTKRHFFAIGFGPVRRKVDLAIGMEREIAVGLSESLMSLVINLREVCKQAGYPE